MFPLSPWLSVSGGSNTAVLGIPTLRSTSIAAAECEMLRCFCFLLSTALSMGSAVLLKYTETNTVLTRVDGLHAPVGFCIFLMHFLMIFSHKSVITQENTVIRFINDHTGENDETQATDISADTSRSTMPVWLSLTAMWVYTFSLGLVLSFLFVYAKFTVRVPDVISKPTVCLLFIAGTFLYTYRVFDLRTNVMIAAMLQILMATVLVGVKTPPYMVGMLAFSCVIEIYDHLCCTPLQPNSATHGSYSPPVFTSQTGTGSDVEVGGVQEAPICGRPAVTLSNPAHDARGDYTILRDSGGIKDA
jgi:hypothetical protein